MRFTLFLFLFQSVVFFSLIDAARILALLPHPGKSHQMAFEPLLKALAKRQHHVTTVSFLPFNNPPENHTHLNLNNLTKIETVDLSKLEITSANTKFAVLRTYKRIHWEVLKFQPLAELAVGVCEKLIKWEPLMEVLRKEYDVVIVEIFNSDCILGLLSACGNNAPKIALSSSNLVPWAANRIGLVDNPAYVPIISTSFTPHMTFLQRLENTVLHFCRRYWFHREIQVKERDIIQKHFGSVIPDEGSLASNYSLIMVNTFHALNGVQPTLPALVEVGGMHLDHTRRPLSSYIERFLNESEHGVIVLSFGSLIKTSTIPKYKEDVIVNTLAKFKQRVIWKYEDSGEEGTLTGNILRVKWLPQYELLQHEKVVAFIAHGGLLGMTEAVSAGKPMVVVPFFGDQPANAAAAAAVGFAKVVPYFELTEAALTEALEFVLSTETLLNARRLSSIWKDRQADPLETAVYWTERVIRWGYSAPLHSAARDMPLYQVALIDVIAVFAVAILFILALSWFILSMVLRLLFAKESKMKMH